MANTKCCCKSASSRSSRTIRLLLSISLWLLLMISAVSVSSELTEADERQQQTEENNQIDAVAAPPCDEAVPTNVDEDVGEQTRPEEEEEAVNKPEEAAETPVQSNTDGCDIHANEQLHALMDRICELCHDMYSHQRPNMRADCRSDCFRSASFKRCLRLFRPMADSNRSNRNRGMRHWAEAMDALSNF